MNAEGIGDGGPKGEAKGRVTQADSWRDSAEPASGVSPGLFDGTGRASAAVTPAAAFYISGRLVRDECRSVPARPSAVLAFL
jgi:hypothetical protein